MTAGRPEPARSRPARQFRSAASCYGRATTARRIQAGAVSTGEPGFEPGFTVLETALLGQLDHSPERSGALSVEPCRRDAGGGIRTPTACATGT